MKMIRKIRKIIVGEIAEYVNADIFDFDDKITARKIGWYIRERLRLKFIKTRKGFILNFGSTEKNLNT